MKELNQISVIKLLNKNELPRIIKLILPNESGAGNKLKYLIESQS